MSTNDIERLLHNLSIIYLLYHVLIFSSFYRDNAPVSVSIAIDAARFINVELPAKSFQTYLVTGF